MLARKSYDKSWKTKRHKQTVINYISKVMYIKNPYKNATTKSRFFYRVDSCTIYNNRLYRNDHSDYRQLLKNFNVLSDLYEVSLTF